MITRDQITPVHSGGMSVISTVVGIGAIDYVGDLQPFTTGDLALWGVIQLSAFVVWFSWYSQLPEPETKGEQQEAPA